MTRAAVEVADILRVHPHVYCVIPAGGILRDHTRWVHPRQMTLSAAEFLHRLFLHVLPKGFVVRTHLKA
jgi:hypothetical protein